MNKFFFVLIITLFFLNSCSENISQIESPSSFKILFIERNMLSGDETYLYTMNSDGTERKLIRDFRSCYLPQWSPNGKYIYYGHKGTIYKMNSDGTNSIKIVDGGHFSLSPLGDKICYSVSSDENAVNCINADGSNNKKIFANNKLVDLITWAPDGNSIVCTDHVNDYQKVNIYHINISGESIDTLATDINLWPGINWSNDGKYLLLNRNEGIYKLEIENKRLTQLTPAAMRNLHSSFSPDDSKIVFMTIPYSFGSKLKVVDSDGNNLKEILGTEVGDHLPKWSPGGTRICYLNQNSLKMIDANGSNKIILFKSNFDLFDLDIIAK